jgi:hypothetical protein
VPFLCQSCFFCIALHHQSDRSCTLPGLHTCCRFSTRSLLGPCTLRRPHCRCVCVCVCVCVCSCVCLCVCVCVSHVQLRIETLNTQGGRRTPALCSRAALACRSVRLILLPPSANPLAVYSYFTSHPLPVKSLTLARLSPHSQLRKVLPRALDPLLPPLPDWRGEPMQGADAMEQTILAVAKQDRPGARVCVCVCLCVCVCVCVL